MGLFKSKAERKLERDLKIKTGLNRIRRQIKTLEKNEIGYVTKARRARQVGDSANLGFIKSALKKTLAGRRVLERQLLTLETAIQIKDQAESHAQFAESMGALSKSIAQAFGSTDLARTTADFEKAMAQAESMERRMEIFLDMSGDQLQAAAEGGDEVVKDDEIDRLIEAEGGSPGEAEKLEAELSSELKKLEKELGA